MPTSWNLEEPPMGRSASLTAPYCPSDITHHLPSTALSGPHSCICAWKLRLGIGRAQQGPILLRYSPLDWKVPECDGNPARGLVI